MAESTQPKPNDPALSRAEALAGWEITATDIARARAKWRRRVPDFEERIALAYPRRGIKAAALAQPGKEAA